ncbi:hypothetical protein ERJ75_001381600 [Trypanosoma vivax]|nr:hypothetical protein ERJ75_001381600 [Trypanosoma vivax]
MRGAQWNSGGLSHPKRVAPGRELHEDMVPFCLLQEAKMALAECAALKKGECQHVSKTRTPQGGGASIFVREGVGVAVGVLEKKVPERAAVTLRFSANVSLTIASAHFRKKADVSSESPDTLLGASGALVVGADTNSRHALCDALRAIDGKGERIVDRCARGDVKVVDCR